VRGVQEGDRAVKRVVLSTLMRATQAMAVVVLLVSALGCDRIKSLYRRDTNHDAIIGTWREVDRPVIGGYDELTFESDGTVRLKFGQLDPNLGEDMTKFFRAVERTPSRYSRGDEVIVISTDVKALRKAIADIPRKRPDTLKGETIDQILHYKLSGDVLETRTDDGNYKSHRYVRVR
jgi:hypothetical protein